MTPVKIANDPQAFEGGQRVYPKGRWVARSEMAALEHHTAGAYMTEK